MRESRIKVKHRYLVGGIAIVMLLATMVMMICPITQDNTSALDNTSTSSRLSVKAVETVSVRLASTVSLELEPHSQGSFGVAQTELGVTTNDPEGFEVFLATTDREAALRGATSQIDTIQQDTVGTSFSGNTWGYSIGKNVIDQSATYHTLPTTSSSILKTERATVEMEDVYQLGFGVHITPSLPAGEYSTSVVLSVVANPATISNLQDLVYMQDMTAEICSNTYPTTADLATMTEAEKEDAKLHPITKQLYDIRDGKQYWVAKLADGNCWMTQNLALNLGSNPNNGSFGTSGENSNEPYVTKLTPVDSDVSEEWVPTSSTNEVKFNGESGDVSADSQYSWNMGRIILGIPLAGVQCSRYSGVSWMNSAMIDENIGATCQSAGFRDVASSDWSPTFVARAGEYNGAQYSLVAIDLINKKYDAHYLIGNYYQWNTATAGTGVNTAANANAPGSICPKGWQLPAAVLDGDNRPISSVDGRPTFYDLFRAYGYPVSEDYGDDSNGNKMTDIIDARENTGANIAAAPMSFVRSGAVAINLGYLIVAGRENFSASSMSVDGARVTTSHFTNTTLMPSILTNRSYGMPIRCVAK